jgi:hypothetical protein
MLSMLHVDFDIGPVPSLDETMVEGEAFSCCAKSMSAMIDDEASF